MSVYATKGGYAFVYFESALSPFDWGYKEIKKDVGNARSIVSIKELLYRYRPDVLVTDDVSEHGTSRNIHAKRIHIAIKSIAISLAMDVVVVKRKSVRATFARLGAINKQDIATVIGAQLEAFAPLVPKAKKSWQSEARRMSIFDAASRALTYYYAMEEEAVTR